VSGGAQKTKGTQRVEIFAGRRVRSEGDRGQWSLIWVVVGGGQRQPAGPRQAGGCDSRGGVGRPGRGKWGNEGQYGPANGLGGEGSS